MFWDINFWEDIVKNYLASIATGITLLVIGTVGYVVNKKYSIIQKITQKFSGQSGGANFGHVEGDVTIINETLPGPTGSTNISSKEEINK